MIKFTKKFAIIASLAVLTAGQFVAYGSSLINNNENDSGQQVVVANATSVAPAQSAPADTSQTEFLPGIPGRDLKNYIAGIMCDVASPCRLARVSKTWHQAVLGRTLQAKAKTEIIMAIPFSPNSLSSRWLEKRDLQILNSVTLRYQPEGQVAIMDVPLATMYLDDANGDLALPADAAPYLCVTRNIKTFVKPDGDNTRKTLVLLLTLSELKERAEQIIYDPSFLDNVAQADLSQNAVCALIRYGGDVIEEWGFRYTILAFQKMSELSIEEICERAEVCEGMWSTICVVPESCDRRVLGFSFIFKSKLDL